MACAIDRTTALHLARDREPLARWPLWAAYPNTCALAVILCHAMLGASVRCVAGQDRNEVAVAVALEIVGLVGVALAATG